MKKQKPKKKEEEPVVEIHIYIHQLPSYNWTPNIPPVTTNPNINDPWETQFVTWC